MPHSHQWQANVTTKPMLYSEDENTFLLLSREENLTLEDERTSSIIDLAGCKTDYYRGI